MSKIAEITATVSKKQSGQRLDQVLSKLCTTFSRSRIKEWILEKRVRVNGNICDKPKKRMIGKEVIIIDAIIKEKNYLEPQDIPLNIIYEDDYIIIINKPRNLVVHPGAGNLNGTILNALLHYYPPISKVPRAGIVHRLDKDTTGLMIVAKTIFAQVRLVKLFEIHAVTREYEAIVNGRMISNGTIDQPISRHPFKRICMSVHPMGKRAITHYRIKENFRMHTSLRLRLETGRTHQIRVHLAYITHPIVGDSLYGSRFPIPKKGSEELITALRNFNKQALHAAILRFQHPISNVEMQFYAPIPKDMVELIKIMRIDFKEHQFID